MREARGQGQGPGTGKRVLVTTYLGLGAWDPEGAPALEPRLPGQPRTHDVWEVGVGGGVPERGALQGTGMEEASLNRVPGPVLGGTGAIKWG